jgi:general stress protein 26
MDICKKYVELHDKIKHIKIAMLTIKDDHGTLRSMPMITMKTECEGNIWFFTNLDSDKVGEIERNSTINLSYTDQEEEVYVSISGRATVVKDNYKMQELWKPVLEEWFPGGLADNDLALLRIEMEHAEYWNGRNMVQIWDTTSAVKV